MTLNDYNNKTIWIIGASSGIGAALAIEIAKRGGRLVLSARRKEALQDLVKKLDGEGHHVLPLDVGDAAAVQAGFSHLQDEDIAIDSAIFMAAVFSVHDGAQKPLSVIHDAIRINLVGAFNMLDVCVPYFKQTGCGQIALCASVAGYRGLPTGQPYCATKAALINLAESLRVELSPENIDVKVINPGFVETPLTDKNDFWMPMMSQADVAAFEIANGLLRSRFEIHFPKRFTFIMKVLRLMPAALYFGVARQMRARI